jgi:hypothetical protein
MTLLGFFLWVFVKDEGGLRSANAYNLEQLEQSNTNSDCKTDQPLLQNVWQEVKYHLDVCTTKNVIHIETAQGIKSFLGCSLQWSALNFCVTITFLPINLCNRSHHLQSPCITINRLHLLMKCIFSLRSFQGQKNEVRCN